MSVARRSDVRLLLELGRGGMGIVYLAVALGAGGFTKLKVLKRLRPDLAADPAAVDMFLEEARLAARLLHPNIVQTNDAGFDGRYYELEMEYLDGQTCEMALRRGLPMALGVYVVSQVLAGLDHAHELTGFGGEKLHLVHRDVSPHNVMLTYEGAVKLLDFGIARAAGTAIETATGMVKGKIGYMAPEQAARGAIDRRADIFAAGVMLWQIVAGKRMWGEQMDAEVLVRLRDGDVPSLREARPDAPDALVQVCARALAVDPADRFATAGEMRRALDAWLAASGAEVGPEAVARHLTSLFAEHRARVRAEIEEQLRHAQTLRSDASVPVLEVSSAGGSTSGAGVAIGATGVTKVRQAREIRGLRRVATGAIGVALLASLAVGGVALRRRVTRAGASAPLAEAPAGCEGNAACARALGRPAICRIGDGACVPLEAPHCTLLAEPGELHDERTLWLGVMFPTTGGPMGEAGRGFTRAADLARRDFVQIAHGLPSASGPARPLGIVACDEAEDPRASARHLADELRLPAVVGFGSSATVFDLAPSVFLPRRALMLTTNASALITSIPQPPGAPRLVWRTGPNTSRQAVPAARFVEDVLQRRSGPAMKVAYLRPNATYALATTEAVLKATHFNGKSAIDNGGAFREIVFADPAGGDKVDYEPAVADVLALQPDVVLFLGEDELTKPVFVELERRWPAGRRHPAYVGISNLVGSELSAWLAKNADARRRFFGVTLPAKTPANVQFTLRYNQTFDAHAPLDDSPGASYDAVYLFAYAAYAALGSRDSSPSGEDLARAMGRLVPPGKPIDVGPTHIFEAVEELRAGRSIDLNGAVTRLDYDPESGEPASDYAIQCVGADSAAIESGLVLRAGDAHLTGAMNCP